MTAERVDLTYRDGRLLTGTVAGQELELSIELPVSTGEARGRYAGRAFSVAWSIASNYQTTEQPASLEATLTDEVLTLATTLNLASPNHPRLVSADIVGTSANGQVAVQVSPSVDEWNAVVFDGHFGTFDVVLVASVDRPVATIRGTVDGERVELTAVRSEIHEGPLRIEGRWHGPPTLCLLAATALSYFV